MDNIDYLTQTSTSNIFYNNIITSSASMIGTDVTANDKIEAATINPNEIEFSIDLDVEHNHFFIDGIPINQYIQTITQTKKEVPMYIYNPYSITNILLIMVVSILAYKFILPRLKISYLVRKFKNIIFKPFKKVEEEIKTEWRNSE